MDSSQASPSSIGIATMTGDGTIVLVLRAETNGTVGQGRLVYPKNHPQYADVLKHLGGLAPGDTKPVKPWPD